MGPPGVPAGLTGVDCIASQFVTIKREAAHRKAFSLTMELSIELTLPLGSAGNALLTTAMKAAGDGESGSFRPDIPAFAVTNSS